MHPTIYKASYPIQINPSLSSFCQSILLFKGLILFIFLLLSFAIVAQLTVVDEGGKPISYVEVFSNNKRFYAETNHLGEINSQKLVKLKDYDTLVFQHYFYESKAVRYGELHPGDTLVLLERIFETEEISIEANKADPKFLKLETCYRSYQYNDDSLTYYIDGKADFISKISKAKFKRYTKEHRSFSNEKIVEEIPEHKVGVIFFSKCTLSSKLFFTSNF